MLGELSCSYHNGAEQTGTSVYELPPGEAVCPYHYEHAEEEWLLVVEGKVAVRTPEGTETLGPWELAFFPTRSCQASAQADQSGGGNSGAATPIRDQRPTSAKASA